MYVAHTPVDQTIDGIHTTFEIPYDYQEEDGITRATISESIAIETESNVNGLNRDAEKMQERYEQRNVSLGMFVPVVDSGRFLGNLSEIRDFFTGNRPQTTSQEVEQLIEDLFANPEEQQNHFYEELKAAAEEAELNKLLEQQKVQTLSKVEEECLKTLQQEQVKRKAALEDDLALEKYLESADVAQEVDADSKADKAAEIQDKDTEVTKEIDPEHLGVRYQDISYKTPEGEIVETFTVHPLISDDPAVSKPFNRDQAKLIRTQIKDGYVTFVLKDGNNKVAYIKTSYQAIDQHFKRYVDVFMQGGIDQTKPEYKLFYDMVQQGAIPDTLEDFFHYNKANQAYFSDELKLFASILVDFIPVIGPMKAVYDTWYKVDLFTGRPLNNWERAACGVAVLMPAVRWFSKAGGIKKAATNVYCMARHIKRNRVIPRNFNELRALARAWVKDGITIMRNQVNDPRYKHDWDKMSYHEKFIKTVEGKKIKQGVEIHYWQHKVTKLKKEFKFKN